MPLTAMKTQYSNSWALIIGIDAYLHAPRLRCARSDAEAVAETLKNRFGFREENISLLVDETASRAAIMDEFWRFSGDEVSEDDRILIFFAGHGYTQPARRGEIGFLVPQDGDCVNLGTLIRWDEITRNADLVVAKHMLFLMDACYGGLAITRRLAPGTSRYLKDMLSRYSRQALTSGKADEVVADANGKRPGHSIFTAHLLDALEGEASNEDGIITANGVMAYVSDRVARDPNSKQSPHFGFLDGDGDFIFNPPAFEAGDADDKVTKDVLIHVPAVSNGLSNLAEVASSTERLKQLLPDPSQRINLDDFVNAIVRHAQYEIREEVFPLSSSSQSDEFPDRIRRYEAAISGLADTTILLSRWATPECQVVLQKTVARMADSITQVGGNTAWLALRWYPINILIYYGGIAALSANNYLSLASLMLTSLGDRMTGNGSQPSVVLAVDAILEIDRYELFKLFPEHENNYVPKSEYLFKLLQPKLDDLLFLGNSYEELFDEFEVLQALIYADLNEKRGRSFWGPFGRFSWKHCSRGRSNSPYEKVVAGIEKQLPKSPLLDAGFFDGSIARFREVVNAFRERMGKLNWF
jgi:hypothetical protein